MIKRKFMARVIAITFVFTGATYTAMAQQFAGASVRPAEKAPVISRQQVTVRPAPLAAMHPALPSMIMVPMLVYRGIELPDTVVTPSLNFTGIPIPGTVVTSSLRYAGVSIPQQVTTPSLQFTGTQVQDRVLRR